MEYFIFLISSRIFGTVNLECVLRYVCAIATRIAVSKDFFYFVVNTVVFRALPKSLKMSVVKVLAIMPCITV